MKFRLQTNIFSVEINVQIQKQLSNMQRNKSSSPASSNSDTPSPLSPTQHMSRNWDQRYPPYCYWHWRFKLPASINGGTHVGNRPCMLFVLKRTPFDKLFVKQALYSKFAHKLAQATKSLCEQNNQKSKRLLRKYCINHKQPQKTSNGRLVFKSNTHDKYEKHPTDLIHVTHISVFKFQRLKKEYLACSIYM